MQRVQLWRCGDVNATVEVHPDFHHIYRHIPHPGCAMLFEIINLSFLQVRWPLHRHWPGSHLGPFGCDLVEQAIQGLRNPM